MKAGGGGGVQLQLRLDRSDLELTTATSRTTWIKAPHSGQSFDVERLEREKWREVE